MNVISKQVITLPDETLWDALAPQADKTELIYWPDGEELSFDIKQKVTGIVLPYTHESSTLRKLNEFPNLTWVQTQSTGYDNVLPWLPDGIRLSNAAGVHASSTAELAIGLVLASLRNIDQAARDMMRETWREQRHRSLADRSVVVIGTGNIGGAIVRRLEPFEVNIFRVGRTERLDEQGIIYSLTQLRSLLPQADVVILTLPLNAETSGLVNKEFLSTMPDGALLVNVGRGGVVNTNDLLAEVSSGRLYAALDVIEPEPLPVGHPLWQLPNVLITPHLGGNTSAFAPRIKRLLLDQLHRINKGELPANLVF